MTLVGAHTPSRSPLVEAEARGADLVEVSLSHLRSTPPGWRRHRLAKVGFGAIPVDRLIGAVRQEAAPVVVETPGGRRLHVAGPPRVAWRRPVLPAE